MITVSAPGKIYLLGEHSVVYGRPALVAAIDKRAIVHVKNSKEVIIENSENKEFIQHVLAVFKKAFSIKELPPFEIHVTSDIPVGSGLGSSAAVAAAVIGALMKYVKNIWNPQKINELAFEAEKFAHGNPSGADNTTVVFGGLIWYRKEFDFLKSIWALPIAGYTFPTFMLMQTGKPKETTRDMVKLVAGGHAKNETRFETIFSDQETQTKQMLLSLKTGNIDEMKNAILHGEKNLETMGVVGNFAQIIIRDIESIGGAAKICGAGGVKEGSGMILCYHTDVEQMRKIAQKHSIEIFDVRLGEEGIRLEKGRTIV